MKKQGKLLIQLKESRGHAHLADGIPFGIRHFFLIFPV